MDAILKSFQSIISTLLEFLPDSPFVPFIDSVREIPYLGYLNYFVPISHYIRLLALWGTAITLFYAVSALLRLVNAID